MELEEDENHEEPTAKRAGERAHNRAGSRIRVAVRGQQRRRSVDAAFGRCTKVHHQVANGSTKGYPSGTSTSLLEFGSLPAFMENVGKMNTFGYVWKHGLHNIIQVIYIYLLNLYVQFLTWLSHVAHDLNVSSLFGMCPEM